MPGQPDDFPDTVEDFIVTASDELRTFNERLLTLEQTYNQMAQLNDMLVNNQIQKLLALPAIREIIMTEVQNFISQELRKRKMQSRN